MENNCCKASLIGAVSCVVLLMCIGKRLYLRALFYVPYSTIKERRGQSTPLFYLELIFVERATEDVLFQRINFQCPSGVSLQSLRPSCRAVRL